MNTQHPKVLGATWADFADEWCIGNGLGYSQDDTVAALDLLDHLWPERVQELKAKPARGLAMLIPEIELGLLLRDCKALDGFPKVMARLQAGERGAYAELVLASALVTLGYEPALEVPLNGKVLDIACEIDGTIVYFEVTAPERPDRSVELQKNVENLQNALRSVVDSCRIEVVLSAAPSEELNERIIRAVTAGPRGDWIDLSPQAKVRRIDNGARLPPTFDGHGLKVTFGGDAVDQLGSTGLVIRWEDADDRMKRHFNREYQHFSAEVVNVLVVDVCAVPDGVEAWTACISERLRPGQNRKVSAVALFSQGILGPPERIRRLWKVIENRHAFHRAPSSLLTGLSNLSDSMWAADSPRLTR